MSQWTLAAIVLSLGLLPLLTVCAREQLASALAALNIAGVITVTVLVVLTVAFDRQPFIDLAIVTAALSIIGLLAFVRFLERRK
jgi:multisubunit Na+/H+ antiporter MnhF subunit